MKSNWTEKSSRNFLFRIVSDFITQIEKKMELVNISQAKLARKMGISKGRVSQFLNDPGNASLGTVSRFARALGMKVSIVAYDDNDPGNKKGLIHSEIFQTCWEKMGKPRDFWSLENLIADNATADNATVIINPSHLYMKPSTTQKRDIDNMRQYNAQETAKTEKLPQTTDIRDMQLLIGN